MPVSDPGVVPGEEATLVRLSVGLRPFWIFGLICGASCSRSMTKGQPPTRHILGKKCLRFDPV